MLLSILQNAWWLWSGTITGSNELLKHIELKWQKQKIWRNKQIFCLRISTLHTEWTQYGITTTSGNEVLIAAWMPQSVTILKRVLPKRGHFNFLIVIQYKHCFIAKVRSTMAVKYNPINIMPAEAKNITDVLQWFANASTHLWKRCSQSELFKKMDTVRKENGHRWKGNDQLGYRPFGDKPRIHLENKFGGAPNDVAFVKS